MSMCHAGGFFWRMSAKDIMQCRDGEEALDTLKANPKSLAATSFLSGNTMLHDLVEQGSLQLVEAAVGAARSEWQRLDKKKDKQVFRRLSMDTADSSEGDLQGPDLAVRKLVNAKNKAMQTPLIIAVKGKHGDIVKYLLSQGADPWASDRFGGCMALHYAALHGCEECIEAIMTHTLPEYQTRDGVRLVDCRSLCGFVPLHFVMVLSSVEALCTLLRYDPNINAISSSKSYAGALSSFNAHSSALHVAAYLGHVDKVAELLKYYAWRTVGGGTSSDLRPVIDPRRSRDTLGFTPFRLMMQQPGIPSRGAIARLLSTSTDIASLFSLDEVALDHMGPLKLTHLAGSALKRKLLEELTGFHESTSQAAQTQEPKPDHDSTSQGAQAYRRQPTHQSPSEQLASEAGVAAAPRGPQPCTLLSADEGATVTLAGLSQTESAMSRQDTVDLCGVCLDSAVDTSISRIGKQGCNHRLCYTCLYDLCSRIVYSPALCPFCRAAIPGFHV